MNPIRIQPRQLLLALLVACCCACSSSSGNDAGNQQQTDWDQLAWNQDNWS